MFRRLFSLLGLRPRARLTAAQVLGRRGERAAARALRRAGYRVLARNVRTPRGEVDLVALDHDVLVIAEVKSTQRKAGDVAFTNRLRAAQCRRLRAAGSWLQRQRGFEGRPVRGDLVSVVFEGRRSEVRIHRAQF